MVTPPRHTSPVHARSKSCTHHCRGALCWPRARTRGVSWQRRRLLVHWRRALGRAHQRRLRACRPTAWKQTWRLVLSNVGAHGDLRLNGELVDSKSIGHGEIPET
ncbi:uncharacterized protein LOC110435068 [Sorghum bicolor]|uniref:uncharacterized protein LOC110435068 n=1 Tax=Sorghum bicolor TaxID=4558 RepID=UPI000B4266F9|nr:uncharacterized protein LOC110435068 [Sorghum bicolor]|eukprot:XP_021316074.1 uncharacterized protein LOC110435068 [Sorghum bicolor]